MQCKAVNYKRFKRRKRTTAKHKFKVFLFINFLLIAGLLCYYFCVISPIICTLSEEKVRSISTSAISEAVEEAFVDENISYGQFVTVVYNDQKEIVALQSNSTQINLLTRRVTQLVQDKINLLNGKGIAIALGTFTGIPFLFGVGPMIELKLIPVGTVNTTFSSTFTSAGINQTKHSLYFNISANVGLILPARTKNFITSLEVLICEDILKGDVPQFVFGGENS